MYKETVINPSHSGFGMYDIGEYNGNAYDDIDDLIDDMRNNDFDLYELGVNDLPEGLEDIRGHIQQEPDRVFGYIDDQGIPRYVGVSKF